LMSLDPSFRDGPKDQTSGVQLHPRGISNFPDVQ
jgi:hypothetical protein